MNPRYVSYVRAWSGVLFALLLTAPSGAFASPGRRAERGRKTAEENVQSAYERIAKEADQTARGMVTLYRDGKRLYLEIPTEMMGRPMLLSGRVSAVSDNTDVTAGRMPGQPVMVRWQMENGELLLRKVNSSQAYDPQEAIATGIRRNSIDPVLEAFEVEAYAPDSVSAVVDATEFFLRDKEPFTPMPAADGLAALFGMGAGSGEFRPDLSCVISVEAFPRNANVRTRMAFGPDDDPFTAEMTVSMLLLPDTIMRPRIADPAVGFFGDSKNRFTVGRDNQKPVTYVNRWNLRPAPQDEEKYRRGEPVVPQEQIVFYVDPAFPPQWRPWLKQGVEDWQAAFERIGFREAIVARDYPDDPDFNPHDARYTCLVYSPSMTANAMGPSWTDPRSGQIIQGSVYFYHNIVGLLHDWRFVQTAAADPAARAERYDMETLGPMLRYVVAHEVGHTLGLKHNMRGSFAWPVDSLRSPSFTSRYGTTSSIMDYARFNYVAQPGDSVKWFLPPRLGPYDLFAVEWAYRPIPEAATPQEEMPVLDRWLRERADDPRYMYGRQTIFGDPDPAAQAEALGDDAVKAGRYGILNLEATADSLLAWTAREGERYEDAERLRGEIFKQFKRYIEHAEAFIGGVFERDARAGDGRAAQRTVATDRQREALGFIWESVADLPRWLCNGELEAALGPMGAAVSEYQAAAVRSLVSRRLLGRLERSAYASDEAYTAARYMDDLFAMAWATDGSASVPLSVRHVMQAAFVGGIIDELNRNENAASAYFLYGAVDRAGALPCEYADFEQEAAEAAGMLSPRDNRQVDTLLSSVYYSQLLKAKKLLSERVASGGADQQRHRRYLVYAIDKALKG